MNNEFYHYGMPRRSGRYPWGSGDRPYQSVKDALKGKRRSEYFTSERTIPKGTKMFRTQVDDLSSFQKKINHYMLHIWNQIGIYIKAVIFEVVRNLKKHMSMK